jgi:hypothetical protein
MNVARVGWPRVVLLLLTAWALVMIVPDLYRVFDPLASFGLVVDNDGLITDVIRPFPKSDDSPAWNAGLRAGDRVDLRAMRCVPVARPECRSLIALVGGLAGTQVALPNRAIDLVVEPRNGGVRRVHLEAARYTQAWEDRLILLADTLVGIAVVVTACLLVWTRPGRMTWGFFLYSIWFNPGQTFAYYALLTSPVAVLAQGMLEALAQGAGYAGLIVFALCFPAETIDPRWNRFRWIVGVVAGILASLHAASFGALLGVPSETIASIAFAAGFGVYALVLVILVSRRRALPPRERQRMLWVIAGCAIGLPAFIAAEIGQSTSLYRNLVPVLHTGQVIGLLYLLNSALTFFVAQAVWRERVVSVAIPLRRGTILTLLTLAVAIPLVELHDMLEHLQEALQPPQWVWGLVVAPVALLALHRLHALAVDLADRLFNRRFHAASRQLCEAGMRVERAVGDSEIDRVLVNAPVDALDLESAALFRSEGSGIVLRAHAGNINQAVWGDSIADSAGFGMRALQAATVVRAPHDEGNADASVDQPCIAVPVVSRPLGPIAVVLYGAHANGNDIDDDECELLSKLADRAAAGYVYVEVARLRRETSELRGRLAALELPT